MMASLNLGAVGVGGIDEVDAQLDGPTHRADALGPIGRLAPDPGPGDLHGAEPQPVDLLAAE